MANYCRREKQGDNEPVKLCGKAIERANPLGWCKDCRKNLPLWPADETATPAPVAADEFQEVA